ncbi:HsdM family class I SAM-dependent methyltransferase [Nocardiopsis algeriensis]|uniref:SAM-dependent methyltransferase n=1 Tax=Nocardiopsis algeriensis TaxID=1478215 RepID=A0A841IL89_9ACTN|nr:N-6 DNA methylase [Nocardiopsis algeriensis]MBB6119497.1 SAM-dependent methyltransferase [Nocardiopsis algeriensis]
MESRDASTLSDRHVTAADIARLAGVTRAAVSNWRRRHDDFPSPAGGTSSSPLFSLEKVRAWLESQNKGTEESAEVRLWHTLRGDYSTHMLRGLADVADHLWRGERGGLGDTAVGLVDALAEESSPGALTRALTTRFLNAGERSGTASGSTARLVRALASLTRPDARSVFDPACGTGSLLFSVGAPGARRTGQDTDPDAVRLVRARSVLELGTEADVRVGDALRADRWPGHRAELVVCDPPAATTDWGREELLMDPRWELALPPKAEGELAWLQHAYAHTAPGGQTAVVLSTSCAYRRTGRRIRADLVRRGLLTDVFALPAGLAAAHSQPVHLWLLRRPLDEGDTARTVRMWDLSGADPDGGWELPAEPDAEVALIDLLDDDVDLTPARHAAPDPGEVPAAFASTRGELVALAAELVKALPELAAGAPGAGFAAQVKVAELADAGLVDLDGELPRSASGQVDTDFLNGFLASAANTRRSTSASGTFRTDARAARIPKLEVAEQRRYGAAFRAVTDFERRARELSALASQAAELAREGLTSGVLRPEGTEDSGGE